jgi:hypothetical protein
MTILAPTGQGKSTILCEILNGCGRKYELALDPKGGDSTLAALGWPRVRTIPQQKKWYQFWRRDIFDLMAAGEPYRAIVGRVARTEDDWIRLKLELERTLREAFNQGGWTIAIDEFQILSDKRLLDLGTASERLLIAARDKGVSVVTLFQAPRWVPRAAVDQSQWIFIGLTRDRDVVDRISEILGRDLSEIRGAIEGLASREFAWLLARNNPRKPLIVTRPPFVARKVVRTG